MSFIIHVSYFAQGGVNDCYNCLCIILGNQGTPCNVTSDQTEEKLNIKPVPSIRNLSTKTLHHKSSSFFKYKVGNHIFQSYSDPSSLHWRLWGEMWHRAGACPGALSPGCSGFGDILSLSGGRLLWGLHHLSVWQSGQWGNTMWLCLIKFCNN